MSYSSEELLQAAQALSKAPEAQSIRPTLTKLLEDIKELIDGQLLDLLNKEDTTHQWVTKFLAQERDKRLEEARYSSLAGIPTSPIDIEVYLCPLKSRRSQECTDCPYQRGWARFRDEEVPICPQTRTPLHRFNGFSG
jgi:hypothetical protein